MNWGYDKLETVDVTYFKYVDGKINVILEDFIEDRFDVLFRVRELLLNNDWRFRKEVEELERRYEIVEKDTPDDEFDNKVMNLVIERIRILVDDNTCRDKIISGLKKWREGRKLKGEIHPGFKR